MSSADLLALHGLEWSLVLENGERVMPVWRHLGSRVDPGELPKIDELRGAATFSLDGDHAMDAFPVGELGWFGPPGLALRDTNGKALHVVWETCETKNAKGELRFRGEDAANGIACELRFRSTSGGGLEISTSVKNTGAGAVMLDRLASGILPLTASSHEIVSWRGRHNAEFVECREQMPEHGWQRETRRGLTGHGGPCGCYVLAVDAGWHTGLVIAMQLAWSGDARLSIERDDEGFWIAIAEAVLQPGELVLAPGETYHAPPLLVAISDNGRNGAMAQMQAAVRERIDWPGGTMRPRPVHLNSWEAVYFAHDEKRIMALVEAAAAIGVERFILDDGWFIARDHDRAGLGDWRPDPRKYPAGLGSIAEGVRSHGMEFGLWVEPEMVNPDSDLYRAHSDWVLAIEGRDRPTARNQLVLDMSRDDVRDYLYARLDSLLSTVDVSYLKWDHNRDHAPSGGSSQIRGAYSLLERLRSAHPKVEIESCAGGGGRIDSGIASYVHRFWTSDNIDAVARIPMQRGFLAFMPPEVMGSHIGASPSHATGRSQSLDFRAAIACQGHLGVELDPAKMGAAERQRLAEWVAFWKEWRDLIHSGRTILGEANDGLVWQAQGTQDEMLLWVIRRDHGGDRRAQPVPLRFASGRKWEVQLLRSAGQHGVLTPRSAAAIAAMRERQHSFSGSWLSGAGLPVPALSAESVLIYHLKAVL